MPTLPSDNEFIDAATTESTFKTKFAQMLSYFRSLLGSDGTTATAQATLGIPNATSRLANIETVVGTDGLAATARQNLGLASLTLDYVDRGAWATATAYHVDDQVTTGGIAYLCVLAHTSGVFATDETAGKWVIQQGLNNITGLQTIAGAAALRATTPSARRIWMSYHTTAGDGGGGIFRGVTGAAPGTYTDNNGTIIVPAGGDGSAAWVLDEPKRVKKYSWQTMKRRIANATDGANYAITNDAPTVSYTARLQRRKYKIATLTHGAGTLVTAVFNSSHHLTRVGEIFTLSSVSEVTYNGDRSVLSIIDDYTVTFNIQYGAQPPIVTDAFIQYETSFTGCMQFDTSIDKRELQKRGYDSWINKPILTSPPVANSTSRVSWYTEFILQDKQFELHMARDGYRLFVDGVPATPDFVGRGTGAYPKIIVLFTFANNNSRHIRIEFFYDAQFIGIEAVHNKSVSPVRLLPKPMAAFFGDSFGESTGAINKAQGMFETLCKMMDFDVFNVSIGSTGISTGGVPNLTFIDHINDLSFISPDIIIVFGSVNDGGNITITNAKEILMRAANMYPHATVIGFGPIWNTSTIPATSIQSAKMLKAACDALHMPYIDGGIGAFGGDVWINAANNATYYQGTQATATASVLAGGVSAISVAVAGIGYDPHHPNNVMLSGGGGTGAVAVANINYSVTDIQLLTGGSGYTSPPTVVLKNGATAIASYSSYSGTVNALTVTNSGANYTSPPTVTITGGGGTGATGTAVISEGRVVQINLTAGGTGYTSKPIVTLNDGETLPAAATALISNGVVTGINISNIGAGYKSTPLVEFIGGGGTGAIAAAHISGTVSSITVTSAGTGYTTPPTVVIDAPSGDATHPKTNGHQMLAEHLKIALMRLNQ